MSRDDFSVSVLELNLEETKWDTAERFTQQANILHKDGNFSEAYQMCKKAVEADPHYYPAKKLLRTIERGDEVGISEVEPPEIYDSLEGGASGGTSQTARQIRFNFGEHLDDTMQYEQVQTNRGGRHAYHDLNGQGSSMAGSTREGILKPPTRQAEEPPQRRTRSTAEQLSKREKYLRELLLEGHFMSRIPLEVFHELRKLLWSEEKGRFVCPGQSCHFTFKKRVDACTHFLDVHLKCDANGVEVRPFVCKTCREKFRDIEILIKHGENAHPTCKWLQPLKLAVEDRI